MVTKKKTKPEARPRPKNRLAELRDKGVKLSQEEVGKIVGCDAATVSRHESGERAMTREQVLAYAKLYKVPSHEIFLVAEVGDGA